MNYVLLCLGDLIFAQSFLFVSSFRSLLHFRDSHLFHLDPGIYRRIRNWPVERAALSYPVSGTALLHVSSFGSLIF